MADYTLHHWDNVPICDACIKSKNESQRLICDTPGCVFYGYIPPIFSNDIRLEFGIQKRSKEEKKSTDQGDANALLK